jgi:hypothetical protein
MKYKQCCLHLDENREVRFGAARQSQSLEEKNIALISGVAEIFDSGQDWDKVKSRMTDERIREFYKFIAALWPLDTDYLQLLPKPDSSLRALYLGEYEPEMMVENVFRFSLYADQIILVNPFDNPNRMADKFNPVLHPGEWRIQTLRLIYHLRILAPWIVAGLVVLIPDPGDFDQSLRLKTWELAHKRFKTANITDEDVQASSMRGKTQDVLLLAPDDYLARKARETNPGITDKEVEDLLAYVRKRRKEDPLMLNQTLDEMPGQMTAYRMGSNLEMGLYICKTIGAFPYTNVRFRWNEILGAASELDPSSQVWSPLTKAFGNLDFRFLNNVDSQFAVKVREEGRLEGFRAFMRKIWQTVEGEVDLAKAEMLARDFKDELTAEYDQAQAEWKGIDRDLMKWAIPAIGATLASVAAMATGHMTLAIPSGGFGAVKGMSELVQAHLKRAEFRKKTPMSVFIDLNKKG